MIVICGTSDSISRLFFISFFQNFDFLGHKWVISAKKRAQDDKSLSVRRALYLRNHASYDLILWYTCIKG